MTNMRTRTRNAAKDTEEPAAASTATTTTTTPPATRRKRGAATETAQQQEDEDDAMESSSDAPETPAEQPRRRGRAKKTDDAETSPATSSAASTPATGPKKRGRPARSSLAKVTTVEANEEEEGNEEDEEEDEEEEEEEASEAEEEEDEDEEEEEEEEEERPKKRGRPFGSKNKVQGKPRKARGAAAKAAEKTTAKGKGGRGKKSATASETPESSGMRTIQFTEPNTLESISNVPAKRKRGRPSRTKEPEQTMQTSALDMNNPFPDEVADFEADSEPDEAPQPPTLPAIPLHLFPPGPSFARFKQEHANTPSIGSFTLHTPGKRRGRPPKTRVLTGNNDPNGPHQIIIDLDKPDAPAAVQTEEYPPLQLTDIDGTPKKRGRPKGSKNKRPRGDLDHPLDLSQLLAFKRKYRWNKRFCAFVEH